MLENNQPIPDAALEELKRLHGVATEGLWCEFAGSITIEENGHVVEEIAQLTSTNRKNNGAFCAAAKNAFPALIARLERAEAERDELRAKLAHFQAISPVTALVNEALIKRDARMKPSKRRR